VACGYRRFSMLVLSLVSFMGKSPQNPVCLQLDCQSTLCFTFSPLIVSLDCFDSEFIYAPLTKLHLILPLLSYIIHSLSVGFNIFLSIQVFEPSWNWILNFPCLNQSIFMCLCSAQTFIHLILVLYIVGYLFLKFCDVFDYV
jgi:hypothetical protein